MKGGWGVGGRRGGVEGWASATFPQSLLIGELLNIPNLPAPEQTLWLRERHLFLKEDAAHHPVEPG